jgi:hypothetical protein
MRKARALLILVVAQGLAGCVPPPTDVPAPASLHHAWMFGIERMRGDPEPQLPYTNRMIADLAAMPNVQVVYIGEGRNRPLFASWQGDKLTVSPWLHGEGNCMTFTYAIQQAGQQGALFGLTIPRPPAGVEPESACVDRAATQFYQALAIQGL